MHKLQFSLRIAFLSLSATLTSLIFFAFFTALPAYLAYPITFGIGAAVILLSQVGKEGL